MNMDEIELYASDDEILEAICEAINYDSEVIDLDALLTAMRSGSFKKLKEAFLTYFNDDGELEIRQKENEKIIAELDAHELGY
jgi:hypothetical protein